MENNITNSDFEFVSKTKEDEDIRYERSTRKILKENLLKNKLLLFNLFILTIIAIFAILAPLLPKDPDAIDISNAFQNPSKEHLFGTDEFGRDYFTRAVYGGRISLVVGLFAMLFSVTFGTIIGAVSGYFGGPIDSIIMRLIDALMSIPHIIIIIVINSIIKPSLFNMIIMIASFSWMGVARIVRGQTLSIKERDYVRAAEGLGQSKIKIIFNHILPNMLSEIIVAASISIARAILQESTLSFLGYGVQLPKASWGSMLKDAQQYIFDMPLLSIIPGFLILFTVLSFNLLGDYLKESLEPKSVR